MSQATTKSSPNPKSSVNKVIYDHQVDIKDTKITQSNLNLTISEARILYFQDQDPCKLWNSGLSYYVCP